MRLIRHPKAENPDHGPTAVAVGNFDGLHLGHLELIREALARKDELASSLMSFEPLPATFFRPERPVPRLMKPAEKLGMCRDLGLDLVFLLRFNARFAAQTPETFARDVLASAARAALVVVGEDFRFGRGAAGDVATLRELGKRFGFEVAAIPPVKVDGERVSSGIIRAALAAGELERATRLLGRPYRICGRVLPGLGLGRRLGYATVNLRPPKPPALTGIFAARVDGGGLDNHPAVASLGRRPTVGGRDWVLEAHLFDFDGDLYGARLEVEFVARLRPEEHFPDLESLIEQMNEDSAAARKALDTG